MEQFYSEIRAIHIGAVIASGSLFVVRAFAANLLGAIWPVGFPARILSWTVDTVLLTAALMLMTIVQQFPFVHGWLTVKIILLALYIVLGWWAFRAAGGRTRILASLAASVTFLFVASIAKAHNPLGIFA